MRDLLKKVSDIYNEIDEKQKGNPDLAADCKACGKCCNFKEFDHLLFVTPPEIEYLKFYLDKEHLKPMQNGICPYNINGKCTVYNWRFAGCRIFNCKSNKDFQASLTESTLEKLKELCDEDKYKYIELSKALKLNCNTNG
jgi:Fe-S-cluster containining protein